MKKIFSTILVLSLLLGGNAYAEKGYKLKQTLLNSNMVMKSKDNIHTLEFKENGTGLWSMGKHRINIVWEVIDNNTFTAHDPKYNYSRATINWNNLTLVYEDARGDFWNYKIVTPNKLITLNNNKVKEAEIMFTIKDKREQCEAIGFEPKTEKFADCVLRLVELDVKSQQDNQIVSAESSGNEALVEELRKQRNLQSSRYLLDLGKQLRQPKQYNSNIYMPQTQRCTIQGFGTFAKMVCR